MYVALVVLVIGGLVLVRNNSTRSSDPEVLTAMDTFAQCLGDAGATFYGAFWCPHCQAQKKLLQNSKQIPYVECSTPDGKSQTAICVEKKITGYPTWEFADGSRTTEVQQLDALAEKTSCALPS
jgi:glutaredoxin